MTAQLFELPQQQPSADFDTLWKVWPSSRRTSRLQCEAIWNDIVTQGYSTRNLDKDSGQYVNIHIPRTDPVLIVKHARVYLWTRREWDDKYKRGLATWLNRGEFLDCTEDDIEVYEREMAAINARKAAADRNRAQVEAYRRKLEADE